MVTQLEEMADEALDEMQTAPVQNSFDIETFPDVWDADTGTFSKN